MSALPLVLASQSPRRKQLLEQLGLILTVAPSDLDESVRPNERPREYVDRLAKEKAHACARKHPSAVCLAADTSVIVDDEILGKPRDDEEGRAMLKRLSGRSHQVVTGIAVDSPRHRESRVVETTVTFRALTDAEIAWYVSTGEGKDKAGGYGSQARAGAFITSMTGSPTSVIGLPLAETLQLLELSGVELPWSPK